MDISAQLWSLVDQARSSSSSARMETLSTGRKRTAEELQATQSLLTTSQALVNAATMAMVRATGHISTVMAALDAVTPTSMGHLQNSLLLSDAELLSVSSSLRAFMDTLEKATLLTATRRRCGRSSSASPTTTGASHALDSFSTDTSDGSGHKGQTGLVAHLRQTVSTLETHIAAKRLHVALAKEELALYKRELFVYGHCGVLSCSEEVSTQLAACVDTVRKAAASRDERNAKTGEYDGADKRSAEADAQRGGHHLSSKPQATKSGFGSTFRVVDTIIQQTAKSVKTAGSHADSALQVALTGGHAVRQLLHAGTISVHGTLMLDSGARSGRDHNHAEQIAETSMLAGGVGEPSLPTLQPYELTSEEKASLEEQNAALLQAQHEASAQDAKAVEASVRELSQLTSLMNEQVMQQSEKFSLLIKNTELAHSHVKKAVGEVQKPLSTFWNPTRQLIALLWACTAIVLTANWLSR
ncbi:hypothetical protein JKF63_00737 [Porcisia hertigi]|uniref:t-SNARE coiled-coil homology domain-containing protein n=1 Tax=Porcisia hertigi TaxID=2761500 RepID=A0A836I5F5_9TRYP|nr:hypothetical protein JKF63_00737 [Porcisia hertigi]